MDNCLLPAVLDKETVSEMLQAADIPAPPFWQPGIGEEMFVPCSGSEIRVFHFSIRQPHAYRPVVMVPGFGATPAGWQDFYAVLRDKAELFYLETREKPSSRFHDPRTEMSVLQSALDVKKALSLFGLLEPGRDFVLAAPCWGAAIVHEGLIQGILEAPTVIVEDPMHSMWFPKWILRYISPLLPVAVVRKLRPFLARAMIGNMKEPTQKRRAAEFVQSADIWKWKRSAEAACDFELYGRLGAVSREVFVLNGTADKIHDPRNYPLMAREMPRGRFLYMPTEECNRERLFGVAVLEFARVSASDGLPRSLARFEKKIR